VDKKNVMVERVGFRGIEWWRWLEVVVYWRKRVILEMD